MSQGIRVIAGIAGACLIVVLMVAAAGFIRFNFTDGGDRILVDTPAEISVPSEVTPKSELPAPSGVPLDQVKERITKKPFGVLIDRVTSPVQPERFSGYHTGTDFETFSDEKMTDVAVRAICSGEVIAKRSASGYGGILVTRCVVEDQEVTVVYGHLRLSSIGVRVGERVETADQIGFLGTGGSDETDGERKHLHLGIHHGPELNIGGYVSDKANLALWIDPCLVVCQ